MAYEFDLEDFNDNLEPFGFNCPAKDHFIEKLEGLCKTFRKSGEDIVDDVVSVMSNLGQKSVDSGILAKLEENLEAQAQKTVHTPRSVKKPARGRVPLAEKSGFILSGDPDDIEKPSHHLTNSAIAKLEGHFLDFSPFPGSPANEKFLKRADPSHVVTTIRGKKYQDKGLKGSTKSDDTIRIISKTPSTLYGGDKSSMVIEAKAQRMADIAHRIQKSFEEIVDWGNPSIPSVDVVYTYGQVIHDETKDNEKFGEHSVALMINDEDGTMIRMDFSKMTEDITLFPGQIIAVRGTNETGEELQVDKIFQPAALPVNPVETDTTKEIWFACGPYTATDNCGYEHLCELLDKVVAEKPDILMLAGPFVDKKNTFLNKPTFNITYDNLLEDLLLKVKETLVGTKTQVIIQPNASRDLCVPPVFPSAPFQQNRKLDKIKKELIFVADPCIFRISGVEVAMTSSEPIQALSNTEFHRSANQENIDRVARLSSHLLTQQCMYPLEPTEVPASMGDLLDVCCIGSTPHIVFAPTKLAPSAKCVNGSVFINSSTLAKGPTGNYAKMSINLNAGELMPGETVADYAQIQILKI
ncbi:DNA polymerase alpha subunit B [Caenorhabditis elegans]|uniref:DNA polymerase alpha subunit B n=1 Tax=Caenorhabditis elegans TaxID=6239 RepID=DPOA2_CAEEL|nr:DNA polymerase alpha subunit B [Caenorhabditis elegans]Q21625.3 RecName: Full=DNA polymerase alpha subunit B; AltName: Full=Division delayed protein 1 [Caenorhabditis elegans]CAA83467.2 DNA polymerase alpha subunit B [Caenorhabditis elegans]|eukprot:NP_499268.1 DNA polymerase alpha subunit B [Caenorhabditis elegans]